MASVADEEPLATAEEGGNGGNSNRHSTLSINQGEAEFANTSEVGDEVAQGLPSAEPIADVEEAPPQEEGRDTILSATPAEMNRALRTKCIIIISLLVIIAGLVALVVGLTVSNKNKNNSAGESEAIKGEYAQDVSTPKPSASATVPPTKLDSLTTPESDKLQQTLDFLVNFDVSDPSALEDTSSPQYKAAAWISETDDRFVSIPTEDDTSGFMFKQRYSLAVVFFSLVGETWIVNMNWMSPDHECEWYASAGAMGMMPIYYGVNCDGVPDLQDEPSDNWSKQRMVTHLELPGKYIAYIVCTLLLYRKVISKQLMMYDT